jgi:membrane protease subunit HflK
MNRSRIISAAIGLLLLIYLLSGLYVVSSDELGVVVSFGKVVANRVPSGMHYHVPWPFAGAKTPQVTAIRRMSIGFQILKDAQGLPPEREESERLTGDMNVISATLMVQYTIHDPAQYLFHAEDPDFLIRKAGEAALCQKIGISRVDDLLTVSKSEVELFVRRNLQDFLDSARAGLLIRSCNLQKIEPPPEVIEAFNEVARAKSNREKVINEARTYGSELIPRARGEAQRLTQEAHSNAAAQLGRAQGDVARFDKLLTEYRRSPEILRRRLFWDTVQQILSKARKVIIEDDKKGGTKLRIVQPTP